MMATGAARANGEGEKAGGVKREAPHPAMQRNARVSDQPRAPGYNDIRK